MQVTPPSIPYSVASSAVAGGAGTATVYVAAGPRRIGTVRRFGQAVLRATQWDAQAVCRAELYRSAVLPSLSMGASLEADADTMEGMPGDVFYPGDQLVVVFTNVTPGTVCYVTLTGFELDSDGW